MKHLLSETMVVTALALSLSSGAASPASGAEIVDSVPVIRGDGILVSFRVEDAFSDDIVHAIETGLEVGFRYNVELKRVRRVWFDEKAASRQIQTTVSYDNLTKRFSRSRVIDGEIDVT